MVPAAYRAPRDALGADLDGHRSSSAAEQRRRRAIRRTRRRPHDRVARTTTRRRRGAFEASSATETARPARARRCRDVTGGARRRGRRPGPHDLASSAPRDGRGHEARSTTTSRRKTCFGRAADFLRASYAELRRVQWPDRRQVGQGTAVTLGFVVVAGAYPRSARRHLEPHHPGHSVTAASLRFLQEHVSLVRHQHLFRAREQGQAEPRAPRLLAEPVARRAPGRRSDRDGPGDEGQPEDLGREADHARLRAGEHGPQRGLLAGREGHARRHRLRRRLQRADPADPGRGRPAAAPRGRRRRSRAAPSSRSANPSR